MQSKGPGSDVPDGSSGKDGVEVVAEVAYQVANEGAFGVKVLSEFADEVADEGEFG